MASKPLPARPHSGTARTMLTVEARAHLVRFIRSASCLGEDEAFSLIDGSREDWSNALISSLDELGDAMFRGGWVTGLRRARSAWKARRDAQRKELEATKNEDTISNTKSFGKQPEVTPHADKPQPELPTDFTPHIAQLKSLVSKPPSPKPTSKHLLLSVAPIGSRIEIPEQDSGFDVVRATIACAFVPAKFTFPESYTKEQVILYGLTAWNVEEFIPADDSLRLVGGTFTFKGVISPTQHIALTRALRLAVYVFLSLLLETSVLADSHAPITYPKPTQGPSSPVIASPSPPPFSRKSSMFDSRSHGRTNSFTPTAIMSFFTKKTEHLRKSNVSNLDSTLGRRGSLDLPSTPISPVSVTSALAESTRMRRFSFMSDACPSSMKAVQPVDEGTENPFNAALERILQARGMLSSSAGVTFPAPVLLETLARKERDEPSRRLRGDEKAGLKTILGWESKKQRGKGMVGAEGFVRHQELSLLYSQYVPCTSIPPPPPPPPVEGSPEIVQPVMTRCDKARWLTFRYYSRGPVLDYKVKASHPERTDKTLGEAIIDWTDCADQLCDVPLCEVKRGDHERRFIHGGVKITLTLVAKGVHVESDDERIEMWQSCKICEAKTNREEMSEGTYLYSFAKYLELLIYSPAITSITPTLCPHTEPSLRRPTSDGPTSPLSQSSSKSADEPAPLPPCRFNIVRHFAHRTHTVQLVLSETDDIFELVVPRLQICKSHGAEKNSSIKDESIAGDNVEGEKKALRREVVRWWQSVADHLDKLEDSFNREDAFRKHLPRLPSSDAAFEEDEDEYADPTTPKASALPPVTPKPTPALMATPKTSVSGLPAVSTPLESPSREYFMRAPPTPSKTETDMDSPVDPVQLLSKMRHTFQRTEQSILAHLLKTPIVTLNEVRREFLSAARGATKRLAAWQKKHLAEGAVDKFDAQEPDWWKKGYHAPPGSNILIREDDWGSIIAFTLGSSDYQQEMANMGAIRPSVATTTPSTTSKLTRGLSDTLFHVGLFGSSAPKPDPDEESVVWHEPEVYSAEITRQEHPKDPMSILSVGRGSTRMARGDLSGNPQLSRMFGSMGSTASKIATPPSAWAKPAAEVSTFVADGDISGLPDSAREILHDIDTASISSRSSSTTGTVSSLGGLEARIRSGKASSIISTQSDSTIGEAENEDGDGCKAPPPLPPKESPASVSSSGVTTPLIVAPTSSYFSVGGLGSGIARAMKYVRAEPDSRSASPAPKNHHGLLTIDALAINDKPHIRYDFSIGKTTQFSCTAYYAKQFDGLRRRCGIDDAFLKSLCRSRNWAAEGGKSKSNFWKTWDDRYIIKTLVNAWNVADLQVLIELAPSYFKYMDATASQPTVLAKLIGFYTVEVKNTETGQVQSKLDLLVMENLFHERKISKTFDLKGIQGRKVKAGTSADSDTAKKTLFDGEWIESLRRTLMLVRPYSKAILHEAIKSDCDFLSKSNIMDYSLLLGVDVDKKAIACGLVDTIGSFTFAKTLESKAKQGFNAGREVTILPPLEYQQRFMRAIDGYFLACPDKWSCSVDGTRAVSDVDQLPSVL